MKLNESDGMMEKSRDDLMIQKIQCKPYFHFGEEEVKNRPRIKVIQDVEQYGAEWKYQLIFDRRRN